MNARAAVRDSTNVNDKIPHLLKEVVLVLDPVVTVVPVGIRINDRYARETCCGLESGQVLCIACSSQNGVNLEKDRGKGRRTDHLAVVVHGDGL